MIWWFDSTCWRGLDERAPRATIDDQSSVTKKDGDTTSPTKTLRHQVYVSILLYN